MHDLPNLWARLGFRCYIEEGWSTFVNPSQRLYRPKTPTFYLTINFAIRYVAFSALLDIISWKLYYYVWTKALAQLISFCFTTFCLFKVRKGMYFKLWTRFLLFFFLRWFGQFYKKHTWCFREYWIPWCLIETFNAFLLMSGDNWILCYRTTM